MRAMWFHLTPVRCGINPVRKLARAGEHSGEVQYEFVKRIPLAAIRSIFGVQRSGFPYDPIARMFCWSVVMKRTLGRFTRPFYQLPSSGGRNESEMIGG